MEAVPNLKVMMMEDWVLKNMRDVRWVALY